MKKDHNSFLTKTAGAVLYEKLFMTINSALVFLSSSFPNQVFPSTVVLIEN